MSTLDGKVAVVTGAGEGIGLGIARRFARDGAVVVIAEVNSATGHAAAETLSSELGATARFIATDVTDRDAVESMLDETVGEFGRVDVLVNNAWGGGSMVRLEHSTDEQMNQTPHGVLGGVLVDAALLPGHA